jgi:hypothetical protein
MDDHVVKATGENESRELRFTKTDEGFQVVIWWGRGDRALATLNFTAAEMQSLGEYLDAEIGPW